MPTPQRTAAGVTSREVDLSGPAESQPSGVPAGVIGTAKQGPAFVPTTVGFIDKFQAKFGTLDSKHFGPLAVSEWLRNAGSATYLRVLGIGDGLKRQSDGSVLNAGFVVGEEQPDNDNLGKLDKNNYANENGDLGRTYFLGCLMSESAGSTIFRDAGLQVSGENVSVPIIRGILMTPSGVLLRLSSSLPGGLSLAPSSTQIGSTGSNPVGSTFGSVVLTETVNNVDVSKQDFVLLLNGHKGTDSNYPNVITASFDPSAENYITNVLNNDPFKIQEAGHYLYSHWDIYSSQAVLTGTGVLSGSAGADATTHLGKSGTETSAFIVTSSLDRGKSTSTVPNFEDFQDRFSYAKSPWVISQKFGGKPVNLFRFHSLDAGSDISSLHKISIGNINPAKVVGEYGTFTVYVRKWDDIDSSQLVVEKFENCNLDPSSTNYVARKIGDINVYFDFDRDVEEQKISIDGSYQNMSNYIRVEISPDLENGFVDSSAVPMGFRGISHLVTSGSAVFSSFSDVEDDNVYSSGAILDKNILQKIVQSPLPFRKKVTEKTIGSALELESSDFNWGIQFGHVENINQPNSTETNLNKSIKSFVKYLPGFAAASMPAIAGDNSGAEDTPENSILDADRFCNNLFTLENIQVVTASSGNADPTKWKDAVYVRKGTIDVDDVAKTRALKASDLSELNNRSYAKFTMVMQGGFNGVNIFNKDEAELSNNAVSSDMIYGNGRLLNNGPNVKAYLKAIDIMKNTTNVDVQLLAIPGIRHPIVTDYATIATEERFDALYIMDIEQYSEGGTAAENEVRNVETDIASVTNTISSFRDRNVDSSFAAAYFPDVRYDAPDGNTVVVPPSVAVLGAFANNDAVGHPWFAPAGFTRGSLSERVLDGKIRFKQENLDEIYDKRINPLVAVDGNGLLVWGQKTLQLSASSLDRVNVRRLLIEIRRQVRDIAQTILFEPNREATLARFSAAVTPRLQRIQALAGLERFKVIIDSSTTTQTDVENNTVRGKIFVQPTKSIEFVSLDFVVANNLQQAAFSNS